MTACLSVMCILDVAVAKPHQMFAGKLDTLHENCDEWYGCASMCQIADGIYSALEEIKKNPAKFRDKEFMMSIFDQ